MLSISKPLNAVTAEKYYDRDNYYLESPGYWHGSLANSLGLPEEIHEKDFKNLLRGFDQNGRALVESAGKTFKDGSLRHSSGIDMTFSAPKSVSVLSYQDERIRLAFDEALNKTLDYAEKNFTQTRHKSGKGFVSYETTGSAAFAVFNHQCSRELDPQLHAHCVLMNLTKSENGKIMSGHNSKFYKNKMFIGQYFRNELAIEIQKLGYQVSVTDRKKGLFEIKGISKDIVEDFSKRREQVLQEMKRLKDLGIYAGLNDAELAALAATNSRVPKKNVTKEFIVNAINDTLQDKNETLENLAQKAQALIPVKTIIDTPEEIIQKSVLSLTKNESAFTKQNLINNASKLALGNYSSELLDQTFEQMCASGDIVFLQEEFSYAGATAIYTSKEMKEIERESIDICKTSITDICVDSQTADNFINATDDQLISKNDYGFTPGQKAALRQIVSTKCQVSVIQGDAGTGKSFSMMYARQLLESQDYDVIGLAPTGKAADELANAAELTNAKTVHKFVLEYEKKKAEYRNGKTCFIVDESGMIGSRMANKLIKIAKELNAKIVFVGDRKQFTAVEAGKFFMDLQDKAGVDTTVMQDVMRQKTAQTKDIVKSISAKDYAAAFNSLAGYKLADFDKTKIKNYKIGQLLTFSHESSDVPEGTNATVTKVKKTVLTIEYKNPRTGELKKINIKPKNESKAFRVFEPENKEASDSYTNCMNEIADDEARLQAVADDYLQCYADKKDALVITATNDDRRKINAIIRETLTAQGDVKNVGDFLLRESKSTNEFANSYETGQIIKANNKFGKLKRGEEAVITDVNTENNTITVKSLTDNSEYTFNPSDYMAEEFSTFTEISSTLGINEKIAFLQNAQLKDKEGKKTDVRNGQLATIVSLDESGNITARVGEGRSAKEVVFNLNKNTESADKYNYIASAYALSSHKSQGMTVDKLIWHANTTKAISSNSFYVAITRCKSEIAVYTDNTEKLQSKAQIEQEKYSTISGIENEIIVGYKSYADHGDDKRINYETTKEADEKLNAAISYLYPSELEKAKDKEINNSVPF